MVFPLANQRSRSSRSTRRQGGSSSSFSGGGGCSLGFGPRGAVSAFGFWSWWILSGSSFHHSVQIHITAVIEQHTATAATNAIVGVVVVSSRHFFDNARCLWLLCAILECWFLFAKLFGRNEQVIMQIGRGYDCLCLFIYMRSRGMEKAIFAKGRCLNSRI